MRARAFRWRGWWRRRRGARRHRAPHRASREVAPGMGRRRERMTRVLPSEVRERESREDEARMKRGAMIRCDERGASLESERATRDAAGCARRIRRAVRMQFRSKTRVWKIPLGRCFGAIVYAGALARRGYGTDFPFPECAPTFGPPSSSESSIHATNPPTRSEPFSVARGCGCRFDAPHRRSDG